MKSLFLSSLLSLTWGASLAFATVFNVSPAGTDAGDGTMEKPFGSLERARDAAREARQRGESVEVILQAGSYELKSPLILEAQDSGTKKSPVVWRAAKGAEARISGGRQLTGWQKVSDPAVRDRLDEAVRDRVLEINLKEHGVSKFGEMTGGFVVVGTTGLELFVNDQPMHISRYPNEGFITVTAVSGTTPMDDNIKSVKEGIFRVSDPRVARWQKEKDPRVFGYWCFDWAPMRQKITAIDPENLGLTLSEPWPQFGYRKDQYFFGFNLLCEIDSPGEWYLDRETGMLYLLPPDDLSPERAMISLLPSILNLKGASHVSFRDLIFEGARDDALTFANSTNCVLIGCTIRNSGRWAVRIEQGQGCGLRNCDVYGVGAGGAFLNGGDRPTLKPGGHFVENSHFHHYARWSRVYNAAIRVEGVGARVANNLIHDAPHLAIGLDGNDHIVEYNEVHNVCEETQDAGALYAWNDWTGRGNRIRYNYFHDIYGIEGKGAYGVYLDDNFSSAVIQGNIFKNMVRPILIGGGRDSDVTNNLFVDCFKAVHIDARGLTWGKASFNALKTKLELMPYQNALWTKRYPRLPGILENEPMAPKGNVVTRNIMVSTQWDSLDGTAKPFITMKENLLDATKDILVNEPGEMPRVNSKAPAVRAIGFQQIPYEKIGLQKSPDRKTWPVEHPVKVKEWKLSFLMNGIPLDPELLVASAETD